MLSEKVLINPARSSIDFQYYKKLSQTSEPTEKGGTEIYTYKFPEENSFIAVVKTPKKQFKIHTYREQPKESPKGIIIFLHGFGSYSNKFAFIGHKFAEKGFVSIGFDFRGFGQSEMIKKGLITNYMDLIDDLKAVLAELDKLYPKELPRFLLGESMGGMMLGMIFFSPAIIDNDDNAYYGKKACWWLDLFFLGNITVSQSTPKQRATKNINIFNESLKNPFIISNFVIPHSVIQMKEGMEYVHKNLEQFSTDFCCVQAGIDKLVDIKGAFDLMEKSKSKDKTLLFLPTAWHCSIFQVHCVQGISVETELLDILDYLISWALKKCQN